MSPSVAGYVAKYIARGAQSPVDAIAKMRRILAGDIHLPPNLYDRLTAHVRTRPDLTAPSRGQRCAYVGGWPV